jgi:hypothetical protein
MIHVFIVIVVFVLLLIIFGISANIGRRYGRSQLVHILDEAVRQMKLDYVHVLLAQND